MPLHLQCEDFPLHKNEVALLWEATRAYTHCFDNTVTVQCVSAKEIQRLNRLYRNKDAPTNVLTFSYENEGDHDIALCMDVADTEARERGIALRDYVALLVVHAVLHACGYDHEISDDSAELMRQSEQAILLSSGFVPHGLSDVY